MKVAFFILSSLFYLNICMAQDLKNETMFKDISSTPEKYTAGTLMSRTVEGLGFRYYWATEGLTTSDYSYRPGKESRSIGETLDHIYNLTNVVCKTLKITPVEADRSKISEVREASIKNMENITKKLKDCSESDFENFIFVRGESEFPFWYVLTGPIEDALWHTGQVAQLRRSSGNPISPNVNFFAGSAK